MRTVGADFRKVRIAAAIIMVLAVSVVPAPLLPPHRLAQAVQSGLGVEWKAAYLLAVLALHIGFYGSLGMLAALVANPASQFWKRMLQIVVVSSVVIAVTVAVRSIKIGHLPMLANTVIPIAAILIGAVLGFGLLHRGWKALPIAVIVLGAAFWSFFDGAPTQLTSATEAQLRRLVVAGPGLPSGDERFGSLLRVAFAPLPASAAAHDSVEQNRASILALGIVIGHERLAKLIGSDLDPELVRQATALQSGTTLRGREDWARHFTLSAALAVLENPFFSDVGGLMKEQLDALTRGSGFSFGDLAADRAGVRFAAAATDSDHAAKAAQTRLNAGFVVDDFFPPVADLRENLTTEQFRHEYGGVGSPRYREVVNEIETRLDRCPALTPAR